MGLDLLPNDTAIKRSAITTAAAGNVAVMNIVANKRNRVLALALVSSGAVTVTFTLGNGTPLTGAIPLAANTPLVLPFNPVGWFESTVGGLVYLNLSAAVAVNGQIIFIELP